MAQAKRALSKSRKKRKVPQASANGSSQKSAPRPTVKTYHNYIGGKWVPSASGETFENVHPADTRDVVRRFPLSTNEDIYAAVNAAQEAFNRWRRTPAIERLLRGVDRS